MMTLPNVSQALYSKEKLVELNSVFEKLSWSERLKRIFQVFDKDDILVTSSFGTKSVFLLHILNEMNPGQKVYFIDTGFHFPETLAYKDLLAKRFGLEIIDVHPDPRQHKLTADEAWYKSDPDNCCFLNKVAPLEPLKRNHEVWISGLMGYQTSYRSEQQGFEWSDSIIKFHPLIDMEEGEFLYHMGYNNLPVHPLEGNGYGSVGCTHCTKPGAGRSGRWADSKKTECGLHPDYFANKMQH